MKGFLQDKLVYTTSTEHYEEDQFPLNWFDGSGMLSRTKDFNELMDLLEELDEEMIKDLTEYV
ncbi:hypothetical protein [Robertmurraya sp. P23]|uniref:hypothetical protein n=1 Tax=Robertmurraya sp. P23 TaxID=3436931 RepID=UPI003D982E57